MARAVLSTKRPATITDENLQELPIMAKKATVQADRNKENMVASKQTLAVCLLNILNARFFSNINICSSLRREMS